MGSRRTLAGKVGPRPDGRAIRVLVASVDEAADVAQQRAVGGRAFVYVEPVGLLIEQVSKLTGWKAGRLTHLLLKLDKRAASNGEVNVAVSARPKTATHLLQKPHLDSIVGLSPSSCGNCSPPYKPTSSCRLTGSSRKALNARFGQYVSSKISLLSEPRITHP